MKKLLISLLLLCILLAGCGRRTPTEATSVPASITPEPTSGIGHFPTSDAPSIPESITGNYLYSASLSEDDTPAVLQSNSRIDELLPYLKSELRSLRLELSSAEETGGIFRLNNTHGLQASLTDRQAAMVMLGLTLSEQTGGAFDLTEEPLRLLWNISEEDSLPTEEAIATARALCDYRTLLLTVNTLSYSSDDIMLDTESYLAGYCIDVLATAIEEAGIDSASLCIDNTAYYREADENAAAAVSLHSYKADGEFPVCTLYCRNYAVSEAHRALYSKSIEHTQVHPYLDLRTGRPSEQDYLSVFVLSPSAALAQITAKACYSRSPEEGNTMLSEIPDTYAIYVLTDGSIYCTDGLTDRFAVSFAER